MSDDVGRGPRVHSKKDKTPALPALRYTRSMDCQGIMINIGLFKSLETALVKNLLALARQRPACVSTACRHIRRIE